MIVAAKLDTESLLTSSGFWIVRKLGNFWYILIPNIIINFMADIVLTKYVLMFMLFSLINMNEIINHNWFRVYPKA